MIQTGEKAKDLTYRLYANTKKIPNKSFQFEGEQEFKAGTRNGT